jgi:fatty-acid desaturase
VIAEPRTSRKAPWSKRVNRFPAVILALVHGAALYAFFRTHPTAANWITLAVLHVLTAGIGVGLGYHRLLAHRSFRARPWFENTLATLGALTLEIGPLGWAAMHRAHHAYEDRIGDAHSAARGFWWSHIGWIFVKAPNGYRYSAPKRTLPDLVRNPYLVWLEKNYLTLNFALFAATLAVFGVTTALWAFPVRWVVIWHSTWLINSLAHETIGRSGVPLEGETSSRNHAWLALISYGEGWHRNHHLAPRSPNNRVRWYELDLNFQLLRLFEVFGWVELPVIPKSKRLPEIRVKVGAHRPRLLKRPRPGAAKFRRA